MIHTQRSVYTALYVDTPCLAAFLAPSFFLPPPLMVACTPRPHRVPTGVVTPHDMCTCPAYPCSRPPSLPCSFKGGVGNLRTPRPQRVPMGVVALPPMYTPPAKSRSRPPAPSFAPPKVAWATCALLALKEYLWGWSHRPVRTPLRPAPWDDPSTGVAAAAANPRLGLCGGASIVMCALYMWTGMAELDEWALPPNPGKCESRWLGQAQAANTTRLGVD